MNLNTNDATMVLVVIAIILLLLAFLIGCIRFALWFLFGIPRKEEPVQPLMTQMSSVSYSAPSYDAQAEAMPQATPTTTESVRIVESDPVPGPTYITVNNPEPQRPAAPPVSQDVQQHPVQPRAYEPTGYVEPGYTSQRPPYEPAPAYGSPDHSDQLQPTEPRREVPDIPYYQPPFQQQPVHVQPVQPAPQQMVYYQPTTHNEYYRPVQPTPEPPTSYSEPAAPRVPDIPYYQPTSLQAYYQPVQPIAQTVSQQQSEVPDFYGDELPAIQPIVPSFDPVMDEYLSQISAYDSEVPVLPLETQLDYTTNSVGGIEPAMLFTPHAGMPQIASPGSSGDELSPLASYDFGLPPEQE
jgi:hypothetical protein